MIDSRAQDALVSHPSLTELLPALRRVVWHMVLTKLVY
jgi:hypothetical protein